MSNLNDKYEEILTDINSHISNTEERQYVNKKIEEIYSIYMNMLERIIKLNENRLDDLEKKQNDIVGTLAKVKETVDLIKSDIYEDDEGYDFEIVCPYCNNEFVADIESELKEEIECPECHNIIELDWNQDENEENCSHCNGCQGANHKETKNDNQIDDKSNNDKINGDVNNKSNNKNDENEDDM